MLHLLRVLIFGLVFTGITILSVVRGGAPSARGAQAMREGSSAGVARTVSSEHHGADAMRE